MFTKESALAELHVCPIIAFFKDRMAVTILLSLKTKTMK